ncbi:hypothetical protein QYE76_044665 [Lolium multiflorum]|uniref:CCHC-type domain-containing protein n=1 Tax=Lolium multiflorum TaxID=4521 RepID=A0AAD8TL76_LOLMU|nr:hypothetical protein QYE76_044665 [Lolium multiflorum]
MRRRPSPPSPSPPLAASAPVAAEPPPSPSPPAGAAERVGPRAAHPRLLREPDEEHSSPHEVGGSLIDLAASNLEDEHTPGNSDTHLSMSGELLCASSGDEPNGMEHMVVEASHVSAWREEVVVHRVVEGPFEFLRENRLCAWQLAKKKAAPAQVTIPDVCWNSSDAALGQRRRYEEEASIARGGEEQLDKKLDVKLDVKLDMELDMELDMKTSHGRAREEREACARGGDESKNSADIMALCNEMRREFRTQDDELRGSVQEISQKLDATNETVTKMQDQMMDIHRSLQVLTIVVDNLTQQQQPEEEDPELQDAARGVGRGVGCGNRGRGFVELGARRVPPQQQDDGLGKPKFSIPKFEGGADVEEYLTWELTIEKLWRLHDYTEDRKVKLASSEFDGYALRWWDGVTHARQEDNELPVLTWREIQGVKTVDVYFMEMEMLMQHGRVRESLEMTMQCFLHGLKYDIKGIVRYHSYTTMNELLHHAREAEAQLAEAAQIKSRATGAGRYTPRAPPSTAPTSSSRPAQFPTSSSKPVSNVSNTKKSESAASTSGSSISTARNRDMACHTCGGKGHFKRDCPNRKVMFINEDNEYETRDDADPYAPEDDDYDSDGVDAFPSEARTIVVSQRALNVLPSASTQRCNLFQTKALVGPDKACKVIIDDESCRNLARKELCTKLKLKYLPRLHPYYIQWLSDNGEIKVNHMVRVEFEIGPYKDSIDFDVVPMKESHAGGLMGHFGCEKTLLMLADHFYWPKMRRDVDSFEPLKVHEALVDLD